MSQTDHDSPTARRILEAAARSFARQGYAGTKMDVIAKAASVNKAAIYYHVGNKAFVYETLLLEHFGPLADMLEAEVRNMKGSRAERLHRLIDLVATMFETDQPFPRIMMHEVAGGGSNLSDSVLQVISRIFSCTLHVLQDDAPRYGINPMLVHLNIISSLMFSSLVVPLMDRARALRGNENVPVVSTRDMAHHLLRMYDALLRDMPEGKEET
jgi:AcrR family transcriptional regulator